MFYDTPDLSYVQPEGNYYLKTSDSYQILKSCSINISDCLKSPGTQWPRGEKIPPAVTLGMVIVNKGNNKITELRTILQRESQNS
jgi:hypothetical protein